MSKKKSIIWSIKTDHDLTSYIMGTMHVRDIRAFYKTKLAIQLIDECACYLAEMNLEKAKSKQLASDFLLPDDKTLKSLISEKNYNKIKSSLMKSFGFNLDMHQRFYPLLVSNMISELLLSMEYPVPLDTYLWNYASKEERVMRGIESYEEQMHIMHSIPIDIQISALKEISRNPSKFRKSLFKLMKYYLQEDLQMLYKLSRKSVGGMRKTMLKNRNIIMADRIYMSIIEMPTFVSIGAAHLCGNLGVLKLLKDKGARIKPVV